MGDDMAWLVVWGALVAVNVFLWGVFVGLLFKQRALKEDT
jgi:hypothetical protein